MKKLLLSCAFICFPVFSLSSEEVLESFRSKDFEKIFSYMNSYRETESLLLNNLKNNLEKFRVEDDDPTNIITLFYTYKLIVENGFKDLEQAIPRDLTKKLGIEKPANSIFFEPIRPRIVNGNLSLSDITFAISVKSESFLQLGLNAFEVKLEEWFKGKHTWHGEKNLDQDKKLLLDLLKSGNVVPLDTNWTKGLEQVTKFSFLYFTALLSTEDFVSKHFQIVFNEVDDFSRNGRFIRGNIFYNYPEKVSNVFSLALSKEDLQAKGAEEAEFSERREYVNTRLVEIFSAFAKGYPVHPCVATFARVMGVFAPSRLTKNADSGIRSFE